RVRDDLLDVEGISQVGLDGLRKRQLAIEVSPARLEELKLTLEEVVTAVRSANVEVNAGLLRTSGEDILVQAGERGYTALELEQIPIRSLKNGSELLLRDVAKVTERDAEGTYRMRFNGRPAVRVRVSKTEVQDTITVVDKVKAFAEKLPERLPDGVEASLWKDRTVILDQRMSLLARNGLVGLILIFFSLWLFTRLRLSIWVAAGLPIAVFGSAILIGYTATTINMLSLFGLLLVSGILVDDAIVVAENVYARLEQGLSPRNAAIEGTMEVLPAVSASIVTTIIAFIPFFYMGGHIGKFVRAIPVVVICCLIMSWIEALIILPSHLGHSLKPINPEAKGIMQRGRIQVDRVVDLLMRRPYGWLLGWALKFRWPVLAFGLAMFVLTLGYVQGGLIKFVFFPNLDADDIQVDYLLEPGAPEAINDAFARRVEAAATVAESGLKEEQSGNKDVILGRLTTVGGGQSESGLVEAELLEGEERDASASEVSRRWREALGQTPEARWLIAGSRRRGPFGKPVHVDLLSRDQPDLEHAADALKTLLAGYPGVYDITDDLAIGKRELVLTLTERGRAAGLNVRVVAGQLRAGLFGSRAEVIQRGRDELEVWIRYPASDRSSLGQLADLRVRTPSGGEMPLRDVATWRSERGLDTVKRYNRRRKVSVTCDVDPTLGNASDILGDLTDRALPTLLANYDDVKASFEGQARERRKMIEGFQKALPWALAGMFAVLVFVFGSYAQASLVMLMIPLGLVGAVIGHVIIGMPLTILSVWGIVALGGILVNDSIVFVDAINRRLKDGIDVVTAVHQSGISRFRPILLTTLTTAAGLMPLILEQSRQAQFLIPMAASLAFGLIFGTVLTLGVLPAGFICINDTRQFFRWLRRGDWPEPETLEPAVQRKGTNR
ncbi:MAG: multidrug efflux pump subunit AcrB, partial [Myxococcota bacterium]